MNSQSVLYKGEIVCVIIASSTPYYLQDISQLRASCTGVYLISGTSLQSVGGTGLSQYIEFGQSLAVYMLSTVRTKHTVGRLIPLPPFSRQKTTYASVKSQLLLIMEKVADVWPLYHIWPTFWRF